MSHANASKLRLSQWVIEEVLLKGSTHYDDILDKVDSCKKLCELSMGEMSRIRKGKYRLSLVGVIDSFIVCANVERIGKQLVLEPRFKIANCYTSYEVPQRFHDELRRAFKVAVK